ncbi:DUF1269 domain-containing protein [Rhodococcus hoagii]|nr:DUF1269 domain-containing protein [Prescottella equi]NKS56491.1 DUF1269 domain-containing protein [Prescottella equi]NKS57001.1 DUF1269 domain-containing protein [Prescottella equi]NKS57008.1 DUF1269 domain-containing protein [Prescottella equi]NKS57012.1 DUF1269 domain-containing protein [Prescottella equi]
MTETLTVWRFQTPTGGETAIATLEDLQKQALINIHDAAVVSWPADRTKPKTRQLTNLVGIGALAGTFWGLLFGILFFIPLIGAVAVGAAVGALTGALSDIGIDDDFINQVKAQITPGTSALFVLTSDETLDRVREEFLGQHAELISTNLTRDDEARLRAIFSN